MDTSADGAWLSYAFFVCVALATVGLLWFRVMRPMLEDFGVLRTWRRPDPPPVPPDDYVTSDDALFAHDAPVSRFEPPEPPQNVQLVQGAELSAIDIIRVDTLARLMAAGAVTETAAITAVWDGREGLPQVKKGGSRAYIDRRDALRSLATGYGWKAPEPPVEKRLIPVNGGRDGYVEL